jgi:DNA-binding MarR family transcriptional regulator
LLLKSSIDGKMSYKFKVTKISQIIKNNKEYINNKLKENNITCISSVRGSILSVLYKNNGKLAMKEIAKLTNNKKSTITDMIKKLIDSGYVKKCVCNCDGRVAYAILIEKAYEVKSIFEKISNEIHKKMFAGFSEQEINELLKSLEKLEKNSK